MPELKPTQVYYHAGATTREDRSRVLKQTGCTIWLTGLSGSGKSTLAMALEKALIEQGHAAYVLDGDNVRFGLNASPKILQDTRGYADDAAARFGLSFSAMDREENIRRIGEVARLFADAGLIILASFVSPYRKDRDAVRRIHEQNVTGSLPFLELFVDTPISTCEERDPKGLYKQARQAQAAGRGIGFTGVDDPYEAPLNPDLTFDSSKRSIPEGVEMVIRQLQTRKLI